MAVNVKPETVIETLAAQGVTGDPGRAQAHAALVTTLLNGSAPAYAQLALEAEPANYAAGLRSNAP